MRACLNSIAIVVLACAPVLAQQRSQRGAGGASSAGSTTLERFGLKAGQAMPDITIYDAAGGELKVADLKGKYSVIVFGSLT